MALDDRVQNVKRAVKFFTFAEGWVHARVEAQKFGKMGISAVRLSSRSAKAVEDLGDDQAQRHIDEDGTDRGKGLKWRGRFQ